MTRNKVGRNVRGWVGEGAAGERGGGTKRVRARKLYKADDDGEKLSVRTPSYSLKKQVRPVCPHEEPF
jgi:hypothetical protein